MKKSLKLAVPMAALTALLSLSAFAETRHQDETWRNGRSDRNGRNDVRRDTRDDIRATNRDFVRGTVERIDYRRNVIVLREVASRRLVSVDMDRTDRERRGRVELNDVRRGDFVTLAGEWRRGGVFQAFQITDIRDTRRR
jgi:hypothetical protein